MSRDPATGDGWNNAVTAAKELTRPYYLKWFYSRLFRDRYPVYFGDCWRYPVHSLSSGLDPWFESPGNEPDILFLPAADWHTRIQRTQHLATEFARLGHRCFYLNPHLGREFKDPYVSSSRLAISRLQPNVFELHVHLQREPVYHHRSLAEAENRRIFEAIEAMLNGARSSNLVVIASLALWNGVAELLKQRLGCKVIYDCHDLWAGFGNFGQDILNAEADLLSLSDLVLFSSHWLLEEKNAGHGSLRGKSVLLRNAVRAEDFNFAPRRKHGGRKTVGYAGSLHFWFDVEIIHAAADAYPEWDFVFFGRVESNQIRRLEACPNVYLMGEVPYPSLRSHFSSMDVGVIPFRVSPLTLATDPLKLYEYFACGLPVVSSPLPELREYGSLIYFAHTAEQFVAQLAVAMEEKDPALAWRRRVVAENESWSARCASLAPLFYESEMRLQKLG